MSKNKILIIIASVFVVVAVVLVAVIAKISNDSNEPEPDTITDVTGQVENPSPTEANITTKPDQDVINNSTEKDPGNIKPTDVDLQDNTEFELGEYKGLKAEYSPVIITESDIDYNLQLLQDENSNVVDLPDRPFESGDLAIVTYDGRVDGIEIREFYVECLQVIIGNNMVPEAMEDKIIGAHVGDIFEVDVDYPSDYTALKEVAGKTVNFRVELIAGFTYSVPDITDTFIKENTEYSSVIEYRTKELERLQALENEKAEESVTFSLKKQVVDNCTFPSSVDNQVKKQYVLQLNEENEAIMDTFMVDADTYYQYTYGYAPGEFAKKLMDSINYDVKYSYALDEIAKKEGIEVTEAEYEEYFNKTYIEGYGYASKEAVYDKLGEQQVKDNVTMAVKREKASKLVYDSAEITR